MRQSAVQHPLIDDALCPGVGQMTMRDGGELSLPAAFVDVL